MRTWEGRFFWLFISCSAVLLLTAPLWLSEFRLQILGKLLAFAIVAIGIDLIWGYTGMLTLGQGVFFGLGAYAMGMHLKLEASGAWLPDFMMWSGVWELPWFWRPFENLSFALLAAVVIPAILAGALGYVIFKNRVRGPYFAIITQALALIFSVFFVSQQGFTGGTNGLTNFSTVMGHSLSDPAVQRAIYMITAVVLLACLTLSYWLVRTPFGRLLIAVRDGENRVRFSGYNPALIKTAVFIIGGAMAGIAGALFVPQVGIISPTMMAVVPSIEMVVWVAVGGRGTLVGPFVGALVVGLAKTYFSESFPSGWLYLFGGMLVATVLFFPKGLIGLAYQWLERKSEQKDTTTPDIPSSAERAG